MVLLFTIVVLKVRRGSTAVDTVCRYPGGHAALLFRVELLCSFALGLWANDAASLMPER